MLTTAQNRGQHSNPSLYSGPDKLLSRIIEEFEHANDVALARYGPNFDYSDESQHASRLVKEVGGIAVVVENLDPRLRKWEFWKKNVNVINVGHVPIGSEDLLQAFEGERYFRFTAQKRISRRDRITSHDKSVPIYDLPDYPCSEVYVAMSNSSSVLVAHIVGVFNSIFGPSFEKHY